MIERTNQNQHHHSRDKSTRDNLNEEEERIRLLRSKLSALHNVSIEIGEEVRGQNKVLDNLSTSMTTTDLLLCKARNAIKQLEDMKAGSYLFLAIVFIFVIFFIVHFFL